MKKTINCSALEKEVVGMRNSLKSDRLDMSFGEVMATYDRDELLISRLIFGLWLMKILSIEFSGC